MTFSNVSLSIPAPKSIREETWHHQTQPKGTNLHLKKMSDHTLLWLQSNIWEYTTNMMALHLQDETILTHLKAWIWIIFPPLRFRCRTTAGLTSTPLPWTRSVLFVKPWRPGWLLTPKMSWFSTVRSVQPKSTSAGVAVKNVKQLENVLTLWFVFRQGNKGKTGVIIAAYMHYSKISAG